MIARVSRWTFWSAVTKSTVGAAVVAFLAYQEGSRALTSAQGVKNEPNSVNRYTLSQNGVYFRHEQYG